MIEQKHIIVVEVDDELPDIYEKLKATKEKEINLFIPRQSLLFQSIINLKILKRKIDELKKNVTIITKDKKNIQRIQEAGINAIEDKSTDPLKKGKPLPAPEEKTGFCATIKQALERKNTEEERHPYIFSKPSRQPLFMFVLISIILFFFVLYIALPSATISIKPTLKIQKSTLNIEMINKDKIGRILSEDDKMIPLYPVTVSYERTIKLSPTGRIFKGTAATGRITIFNTTKDPWPIVANSRVQNKDGLVFLTRNFVTVPGGTPQNPGTISVDVIARDKDANDIFIGSRGNIGPSRFFFPGLSQYNQSLIYAANKEAFTGGTDFFDYFVTKDDLTIAKQKVMAELQASAIAELKKEVARNDTSSPQSLKLFDRSDKMIITTLGPTEVRAKENDKINELTAWGKMTASGYYYNEKDLQTILENNLKLRHISPTEKILKMKDGSLQINEVLETNPAEGSVKVNASLEGIVAYDFLNSQLNLVQQIRENVAGKNKQDAEQYINNLKEISEARISVWPIWSPTLPTIPENIKIQVEE